MSNAKSDAKRNEKSDDAMHSRAIYRALADSAPTDRRADDDDDDDDRRVRFYSQIIFFTLFTFAHTTKQQKRSSTTLHGKER